MPISFAVEEITDEKTGQKLNAIVKTVTSAQVPGEPPVAEEKEVWCTILDLDRLFDKCVKKWGSNWNLEKVLAAIDDSEVI